VSLSERTGNGLILIGTRETLPGLWASVRVGGDLPGGRRLAGCVVIDGGGGLASFGDGGPRVLGGIDDLPEIVERHGAGSALVCAPLSMRGTAARLRPRLEELGLEVRETAWAVDALRGPAGAEHQAGRAGSLDPETLDLAALTGRRTRAVDGARLDAALAGKRVLITGAGGSIGSELARLAASRGPAELVLMDRSENALFEIDHEIGSAFPGVSRRAALHDVVDAGGTLRLMLETRPQTVFHAAAHKHVPMLEDHPSHAVNNNLFGTKAAADAAARVGVERFVLVSTDKAVNPSSVMGATKRLAEQYVRGMQLVSGRGGGPRYCMVRFGNVLGSSGSVLTVWRRQIAAGGPVTVTHPEMTRYFMSIPEAASLVAQASALEPGEVGGADVFVLDMGSPGRVVDLAARAIRASGFEALLPGQRAEGPGDAVIPVRYTGARPGEKIHEELSHGGERLERTPIEGVMAWASGPPEPASLHAMTLEMGAVRFEADAGRVLAALRRWTPTLGANAPAEPEIVVRGLDVPQAREGVARAV